MLLTYCYVIIGIRTILLEFRLWRINFLSSRRFDFIAITSGPRSRAAVSRLQSISIARAKIRSARSSRKSDFVRIHATGTLTNMSFSLSLRSFADSSVFFPVPDIEYGKSCQIHSDCSVNHLIHGHEGREMGCYNNTCLCYQDHLSLHNISFKCGKVHLMYFFLFSEKGMNVNL